MATVTTSLKTVPTTKPTNVPHALRSARAASGLKKYSPTKAPTNGPTIIPKGPNHSPTIAPTKEPITPRREALYPFASTTHANTSTNIVDSVRSANAPTTQGDTLVNRSAIA